jgi:Tol biopolymer transport system component
VSDNTNLYRDIFVHDRNTGETGLVSVDSDGTQGSGSSTNASISGDGRYVAFRYYASNLVPGITNGKDDVFVHDLNTGEIICISVSSDGTQGNGVSYHPSMSPDGRYVAFASHTSNLVLVDTNNSLDVFMYDRGTGITSLISLSSDGTQGNSTSSSPSISIDGDYVAFTLLRITWFQKIPMVNRISSCMK